jgi:hypothetical protein
MPRRYRGRVLLAKHVIGDALAQAQRPFIAFKEGRFLPVTGTSQSAWQFVAM